MAGSIILEFVAAINKHDLEAMAALMTDDHIFVDAHNNSTKGKENMKASWKIYFDWFPDYTIEVSDIIQGETCIAVFGFANGTFRNLHNPENSNHFHLPAAWKVVVESEKIKIWQVFADAKVPTDIIERNKPNPQNKI
jgi:hypothetical protein